MTEEEARRDGASTDEVLIESQALLRETMEYLARLSPNPMTAQLVRKIRGHLDSPATASRAKQAAQAIETAQHAALRNAVGTHGSAWFLPSGLPALELQVIGSLATITSPAAAHFRGTSAGKTFALDLAAKLGRGIEIELHADRPAKRLDPDPGP